MEFRGLRERLMFPLDHVHNVYKVLGISIWCQEKRMQETEGRKSLCVPGNVKILLWCVRVCVCVCVCGCVCVCVIGHNGKRCD